MVHRRRLSSRIGVAAFGLSVLSPHAVLAENRPIPIEVAAGEKLFPAYTSLRVSPDGTYVAYTIRNERRVDVGLSMRATTVFSTSGVPSVSAYACDVYVTNTRTGKTTIVSRERASNWSPVWSRRGNRLAFVSDRDGAARLWTWDAETARLRRVSPAKIIARGALDQPYWVDSDASILAKTVPDNLTFEAENAIISKNGHRDQRFVSSSSVKVYDHAVEPQGPSRATQRLQGYDGHSGPPGASLSLIDVRTGASSTLAAHFGETVQGIDSSGEYLLLTNNLAVDPKNYDLPLTDITVIDLLSRKVKLRIAGAPTSRAPTVSWSPSSLKFAYFARSSGSGQVLVVADVRTSSTTTLGPQVQESAFGKGSLAWTPDARSIVTVVGGQTWRIDVTGKSVRQLAKRSDDTGAPREIRHVLAVRDGTEVWQPNDRDAFYAVTLDPTTFHEQIDRIAIANGDVRAIRPGRLQYDTNLRAPRFDASADGAVAAFVAWDAAHPPDVYVTTNGFRSIRQLTHLNPELDCCTPGKQEVVSWTDGDGRRMLGTLLLPADYVAGRRYPTIVWQRAGISGPNRVDSYGLLEDLGENWQIFATRGYAVFLPDFPTSTAAAVPRLTKTSLLPALDQLVAMGVSDPDRFGITGESLGGYTTLSIIAQTDRFRAAVSTVGYDNEFNSAMMFLPSGDAFRLQEAERFTGGTPWKNRDCYIAASPFFFLDRIRTPVLIIATTGDWTDTLPQVFTDEAFVGLRRLNQVDVEYALYSGGHGPFAFSYADRVDFWYRILHWFDKYLKSAAVPAQRQPAPVPTEIQGCV